MKKIFKYPLRIVDEQIILMPTGARILHAGLDPAGRSCVWAAVKADEPPTEEHTLYIFGTGDPIPDEVNTLTTWFLSTLLDGPFVWHVFLKKPSEVQS